MALPRIPWIGALVITLVTTGAGADDRATAQRLFQEGKALMSAGKVADACPKFAEAAQLSPTAGVRLNLGDCYEKLGRSATAATTYDGALAIAERAGDKPAADLARSRLAALRPRLSYIRVTVSPEAAVPGLEIRRDGEKVPQPAWGTPVAVDPGDHEMAATATDRAPWTATVSVTAPGEQPVTIPVLAPSKEALGGAAPGPFDRAPAGSAAGSSDSAPAQRSGLFTGAGGAQRTIAVIGAGLGLAGIAAGSYFGAVMLARKSDYQQHEANGQCSDLECQTASHDAASAGDMATLGFVAGGALLATGVVLWLTAPKGANQAPAVAILPAAGPGSMGLAAAGRW